MKSESNVTIDIWESYFISFMAFCIVIVAINLLLKYLLSVFENKMDKWYIVLSIPLFFLIAVVDIVNFGASNGVMVVSNANGADYWNLYYNQLLSHSAICILTALSICAAGFYIFGMDRIYIE